MKCGRKQKKNLTEIIKKYPHEHCTQQKMENPHKPAKPGQAGNHRTHFAVQATGT
jgi:hypothetical protein